MQRIPSFLAIAVTAWILQAAPATAQTAAPGTDDQKPPVAGEEAVKPPRGFVSSLGHNLFDDVRHMRRRNSVYWLAGGTALALAIHPEDGKINRRLIGNSAADAMFRPGKYVGNGAVIGGSSVAMYIAGRWKKMPRLQHLGMDEIEGAILAQGVSEAAKVAFRRDRPVQPGGKQASGYSLPSGHATLTFTAATILQQHLGTGPGSPPT